MTSRQSRFLLTGTRRDPLVPREREYWFRGLSAPSQGGRTHQPVWERRCRCDRCRQPIVCTELIRFNSGRQREPLRRCRDGPTASRTAAPNAAHLSDIFIPDCPPGAHLRRPRLSPTASAARPLPDRRRSGIFDRRSGPGPRSVSPRARRFPQHAVASSTRWSICG